jgi:hypothetical protein
MTTRCSDFHIAAGEGDAGRKEIFGGKVKTEQNELRKLLGKYDRSIYQLVRAGQADQLSGEDRSFAEAIQEHLHLSHIHNALEFADVREGQQYEIQYQGEPLNPLLHLTMHSAVKQMVEQSENARLAFNALLADGINRHHAEHILSMVLGEALWNAGHPSGDKSYDMQKTLRKLSTNARFRNEWISKTSDAHPWAEAD